MRSGKLKAAYSMLKKQHGGLPTRVAQIYRLASAAGDLQTGKMLKRIVSMSDRDELARMKESWRHESGEMADDPNE